MNNLLYLVIPCYNEQEVLPETARRLRAKMSELIEKELIDAKSRIVFVNDGSRDSTWSIIDNLHREDPMFSGISLSRNRGHQNALLAGLMAVRDKVDMAISMDADLQDDIDAIDSMVEKFRQGCDIVYGVRSNRETDTWFKRSTAELYYKFIQAFGGDIVFNHADYRLMSKRALQALSQYEETALFLRGIVPMIGFKCDTVYYSRGERFAGESKYPLGKMISLAVDGITSLSVRPLRLITLVGFLMLLGAFMLGIFFVVRHFMGYTIWSWKISTLSILLVGGLVTLCLGIVGEYAGKTYMETKKRPRFFIDKILHDEDSASS